MQGAVVSYHTLVPSEEKDYFGSPVTYVRGVNRVALSLVPGLNKISIDVKRKDGTLHTPVTPEAMAKIFFHAGLMMIFSHFAEILTLSLDGASENGRVGPGGEAMCGRNSQMDQLMIRRAIWSEVKLRAEATGVDDLLNRFYKNDDPAGLLRTLEQILRDCRREARAASAAKKRSKNISCDDGTSLAQEVLPAESTDINEAGERGANTAAIPSAGGRTADAPDCSLPRASGCSDDLGSRHLQEQSPGECSNMDQGGETNANTAGGLQQAGRVQTIPEGHEHSDEDGGGIGDESDDNDDHDSVGSSSQDHDSESDTATQRGDSRVRDGEGSGEPAGQSAEGSGEPAGPAKAWDFLKPWIGLRAPVPREPPPALNTKGPVKPYRKSNDNGERNQDGALIGNKYDYEEAIHVLRRRHEFLRCIFQRWYTGSPPRFRALKEDKNYKRRLKKYMDRADALAEETAVAPGVGDGGYFQDIFSSLKKRLIAVVDALNALFQHDEHPCLHPSFRPSLPPYLDECTAGGRRVQRLLAVVALFQQYEHDDDEDRSSSHDEESPAGGGECPAGGGGGQAGAAAATEFDPVGRSEDSEAAAAKCAKLAQAVFRHRLSRIRRESYVLQQRSKTKINTWRESKSARYEIRRNPLRFFACMDQRHAPGNSAWSKICVAAHCMSHRLHNATKGFFNCLNNGLFSQVQATAACIKNVFVWMPMKTAIDLLLGAVADQEDPGRNSIDREFYVEAEKKIQEQQGVTLDAVKKEVAYDSVKGISEPSTCIDIRWGTVANSASDLLLHYRLYAFGMIKRFSKGNTDAQVAAAASVFSKKGFVSSDFPDVQIDKQVQRAFGTVTKITELAQLAIVDFLNVLCIQPMLKGISSDNHCAVDEMMGVDSIPRRMIYLFGRGIWLRSGMRGWNNKQAVLCRTDGGEFDPDPKSMKLLNVNCDVNSILGSAGNEKTSGAVKKLLEVFKMLADSGQEVMPEDLLLALEVARPSRSGICDPSSGGDEVSFATNMSKLMYVTSLVAGDVVEALRFDFDREIFTPQGLIGGMLKQTRSSLTILENGALVQREFVSPHPIALANALVLLVLARDLRAHHAPELLEHGAEIQHFTPSYLQVLSKTCSDQNEEFLGIQNAENGESRSIQGVPLAPKSLTLNKKFKTYEKRINGQTTELSMPLIWYPELFHWSRTAQCSCCSSNFMEQTFSTPSVVGRGKGDSSLRVVNGRFRMKSAKLSGMDLKKTDTLLFKVARKLAKHPKLKRLYEEDRVKGDAMHSDYMRFHLPEYIGKKKGNWRGKSHQKPCRPDRFVKIAEGSKEERYLDKLTRKLCERTGKEYVPPVKSPIEQNSSKRKNYKRSNAPVPLLTRKVRRSAPRSSDADALGGESERLDAGARSSDPVASAAVSEEYGDDGAGESPESGESRVQVQEAANASALAESAAQADKSGRIQPGDANLNVPFIAGPAASERPPAARLDDGDGGVECDAMEVQEAATASAMAESAARADKSELIQPGDANLNVPFIAGPAASEGPPAARLDSGDGGVECDAIEDARHAPAPYAGDESMADTEGADGTQEIIKDLEDIYYGNKWSIDIICEIHNEIWEEGSDHRTWQHSNVVFHTDLGGLYASITRVPGFRYAGDTRIAFNVRQNSSRNHYIMYDQWAGAKLVSVVAVRRPDGDWSKTVDFRQIFTTAEALNVSDALGGGIKGYMGIKELNELKMKDQRLNRTTYHNGDFLHSGNIKDVIGVVRWAEANTRGQSQVQGLYTDYPKSDLIYIGPHISEGFRAVAVAPSPPGGS